MWNAEHRARRYPESRLKPPSLVRASLYSLSRVPISFFLYVLMTTLLVFSKELSYFEVVACLIPVCLTAVWPCLPWLPLGAMHTS